MKKLYIRIEGMTCSHCEETIRKALLQNDGIKEVTYDHKVAEITYEGTIDKDTLKDQIQSAGYYTKKEWMVEQKETFKKTISSILIFLCILVLLFKIFGFSFWNIIPNIDTTLTYPMLFVTGLLTSIHCVSMCGSFSLLSTIQTSKKKVLKRSILYNFGRVISYTALGGIVGFLGSILQINERVTGAFQILAGIVMILMALQMLGLLKSKKIQLFQTKIISKNPFIIGLFNGFMPCGPLQSMQVYALSTGSAIGGAFSMFLFSLGTVPLMLFSGILFHLGKGKWKAYLNQFASLCILFFSFAMVSRGFTSYGISFFSSRESYLKSEIIDGVQIVEFDLSYNHYEDILLKKDIPTKIIIHVEKKYLTGCNNELLIREFGITKKLEVGENIIEFTPTLSGTYTYTCWMNMIKNKIKVV